MFAIYVDGVRIYDDVVPSQELKLISPNLSLEANTSGEFTFTLPPTNIGYNLITVMKSQIVVTRNEVEIWSGRAISVSEDFWKNKNYTCEGELGYLNDSSQTPREYHTTIAEYLRNLLSYHNERVEAYKQFTMGICTVAIPTTSENASPTDVFYTSYNSTWYYIAELVSTFGGYLRIRKENGVRYLDYLKDVMNTNSQVIEFGHNLIDYAKNYELMDIATVIIPIGKKITDDEARIGPVVTPNLTDYNLVLDKDGGYSDVGHIDFKSNKNQSLDSVGGVHKGVYIALSTTSNRYLKVDADKKHKDTYVVTEGGGNNYKVSSRINVTAGETYYYSAQMNRGRGMYAVFNSKGQILASKKASGTDKDEDANTITTAQETTIEIPPGGSYMYVAGYGNDLPLTLYKMDERAYVSEMIPVDGDTRYKVFVVSTIGRSPYISFYKGNAEHIQSTTVTEGSDIINQTFTTPPRCKFIRICSRYENNGLSKVITDNMYAIYQVNNVKPGETYFYSGQMDHGYGIWAVGWEDLDPVSIKMGGSDLTTYQYDEITVPDEDYLKYFYGDNFSIKTGNLWLTYAGFRKFQEPVLNAENKVLSELEDYITIASVNNDSIYLEAEPEVIEQYGRVEKVLQFNDIDSPDTLLDEAQAYLRDYQYNKLVLEISAVDLNYLNADIENFKLLDKVRCLSRPHGMNKVFTVSKLEIPLDDPAGMTLVLSDEAEDTSITAASNQLSSDFYSKIELVPTKANLLKRAKEHASALINAVTNGYVTIIQTDDHTQELVITDTPDYMNATRVWRWNLNGLGYSSNGFNGPYGLAMTMDGAIVADFITTGTLNANRVRTGLITDEYGLNFWNLDTGEFALQAVATTVDGMDYNDSVAAAANSQIEDFAETILAADFDAIRQQIDGKIDTWYLTGVPTLSNPPANSWTTDTEKDKHVGDLYYDGTTGKTYIFNKVNDVFQWEVITDSDINRAMTAASSAQATADGKMQVFTSQPTPPYDVGDLWCQGSSGDIKTCTTKRSSGSFTASDWSKLNKYTDDTAVNTLNSSLTQQEIFNRLTNNGQTQGIYLTGGKLYLNATYIKSGTMSADYIKGGVLELGPVYTWDANNAAHETDASIKLYDGSKTVYGEWTKKWWRITYTNKKIETYLSVSAGGASLFNDIIDHNDSDKSYPLWAMGGLYDQDSSTNKITHNPTGELALYHQFVIKHNGWWSSDSEYVRFRGFMGGYGDSTTESNYYHNCPVYIRKNTYCYGNFTVGGTKSRYTETDNYGGRLLYCYEMPSPMFGDIGEGIIDEDGEAVIAIDDIFNETISTKIEYQVFLQKEGPGDCWVDSKQSAYFVVKGTPGLKFAWELKAKQIDYTEERLNTTDAFVYDRENNIEREYDDVLENAIDEQERTLYEDFIEFLNP